MPRPMVRRNRVDQVPKSCLSESIRLPCDSLSSDEEVQYIHSRHWMTHWGLGSAVRFRPACTCRVRVVRRKSYTNDKYDLTQRDTGKVPVATGT